MWLMKQIHFQAFTFIPLIPLGNSSPPSVPDPETSGGPITSRILANVKKGGKGSLQNSQEGSKGVINFFLRRASISID